MEIIKLNLIPSGVNPTCHCSQYDEGRVIRIELFDGLTPYTLQSGDTVTLNVRKPDNTIVTGTVSTTQGNNYVDIVTTEQICACVGYNLCDLTITNGSVVIGTLNFIMQIERDVLADGVPSQSVIEDLDALVQEAVGDNYYTKTEVDTALNAKADKSTTYTKTEIDSALALKANSADVYTKTQVDTALSAKADASNVYTKSQIDAALALKADKSEVYAAFPTDTAQGSIASFTDGADDIPLKSLIVNIDPEQAGSGDPSPNNPRALSFWTACNVWRMGKNIFNENVLRQGDYNGTNPNIRVSQDLSDRIPCKSGQQFIISAVSPNLPDNKNLLAWVVITDKNNTLISTVFANTSLSSPVTFTCNADGYLTNIFGATMTGATGWQNITVSEVKNAKIMVRAVSSNSDYEIYKGNKYNISFGESNVVCKGKYHFETGLLEVTHKSVNLGNLDWLVMSQNTQKFTYQSSRITDLLKDGSNFYQWSADDILCSIFKSCSFDDRALVYMGNLNAGITIRTDVQSINISDNRYIDDPSGFKSAMSGIIAMYPLDVVQTYQLNPTQINTFLRDNNIVADTGDVDVVYRADVGLYIDKKISQTLTILNSTRGSESLRTVFTPEDTTEDTPINNEER